MSALDASWSFLKAKPLRDQPGWNRKRKEIARRKELAREREAATAETQPTTLDQFTQPDAPVDDRVKELQGMADLYREMGEEDKAKVYEDWLAQLENRSLAPQDPLSSVSTTPSTGQDAAAAERTEETEATRAAQIREDNEAARRRLAGEE